MKLPPCRQEKRYDVSRSPLFGLTTKRKLASILGADISAISALDKSGLLKQYNIFKCKQTLRFITEPRGDLRLIHQRLLRLFSRIEAPGYVHSAIKKRSYLTNARSHLGDQNVLKIDLKKFFPSIKFHHVHGYFRDALKCAPDVAAILSRLCTVETTLHGVHLPTGSCISPLLSFLVNQSLFDKIAALCAAEGCVFTVYVDDITISGKGATRALLTRVAIRLHNAGYGYHKIKTYTAIPATVTGVILANGKLCLPHARAKRIREVARALNCATGEIRAQLLSSLVGRLSEAEQIDPAFKAQRAKVLTEYAADWKQVTSDRAAKAKAKLRAKTRKATAPADTAQVPGLDAAKLSAAS